MAAWPPAVHNGPAGLWPHDTIVWKPAHAGRLELHAHEPEAGCGPGQAEGGRRQGLVPFGLVHCLANSLPYQAQASQRLVLQVVLNPQLTPHLSRQAFQAGAGSKKGRSAFIDITNIESAKAVFPPEKVRTDLCAPPRALSGLSAGCGMLSLCSQHVSRRTACYSCGAWARCASCDIGLARLQENLSRSGRTAFSGSNVEAVRSALG